MPYDWYVIYNKVTGKKRPGGLMHYGKALAMMWDLLRGEATDAEMAAYDAAIRNRDEAEATRLHGLWQARGAWQIMEWGEYQTTRAAQTGRGSKR